MIGGAEWKVDTWGPRSKIIQGGSRAWNQVMAPSECSPVPLRESRADEVFLVKSSPKVTGWDG